MSVNYTFQEGNDSRIFLVFLLLSLDLQEYKHEIICVKRVHTLFSLADSIVKRRLWWFNCLSSTTSSTSTRLMGSNEFFPSDLILLKPPDFKSEETSVSDAATFSLVLKSDIGTGELLLAPV